MGKEYLKSVEDEIDWKVIDQLHSATSSFSSTSLELKKIYFILVGIAIPSLIKLAGDKLDLSLFISIYFLTITFWLLDSFTYFYQEKLREKMNNLFLEIRNRNKETVIEFQTSVKSAKDKEITLEQNRTGKTRIKRSLFNTSLLLYLFIFFLTTIGLALFKLKFIA